MLYTLHVITSILYNACPKLFVRTMKALFGLSMKASSLGFTTRGLRQQHRSMAYRGVPIRSSRHSLKPLIASPNTAHSRTREHVALANERPSGTRAIHRCRNRQDSRRVHRPMARPTPDRSADPQDTTRTQKIENSLV